MWRVAKELIMFRSRRLLYFMCFASVIAFVGVLSPFTIIQEQPVGSALVAPRVSIAHAQGLCYQCHDYGSAGGLVCIEVGPGSVGYKYCAYWTQGCVVSGYYTGC